MERRALLPSEFSSIPTYSYQLYDTSAFEYFILILACCRRQLVDFVSKLSNVIHSMYSNFDFNLLGQIDESFGLKQFNSITLFFSGVLNQESWVVI